MALYIKKFGGSSVATPSKMEDIARRVLSEKKTNDKVVIVVSAMGDSTDTLLSLAEEVSDTHHGREVDMLITTGEQVSSSLMAMTFAHLGASAVSLTGAQAGICCRGTHGKAFIDKVPLCKVIMGDERQSSLTLPRLFMLPSIQSIPVYGFLFHPTKITSWGKNVQEYGVKTIKSVENKYL